MLNNESKEYDLVVVGAGAGGIAAASSAARLGLRVALIEKYGFSGGLATSAYVGTICGLYQQGTGSSELAGNFANEFRQRIQVLESREPISFAQDLFFLPYKLNNFERICEELLEETGVDKFFHATCIGSICGDLTLKEIEVLIDNRRVTFRAPYFVDASGEAVLVGKANLITDKHYQAPAYVFSLGNLSTVVQSLTESELSKSIISSLILAKHEGLLDQGATRCTVVPGSLEQGGVSLKLAYPESRKYCFNELTKLEQYGRRTIRLIVDILRNSNELFSAASLSYIAPQLGIRSGPRPLGEYVLSGQDVLGCRTFRSAIAHGLWPLEKWSSNQKAEMTYLPSPSFYQIPAESLCVKGIDNLFSTGRGISADEDAISSARVIGTALATGSAAGSLAAYRFKGMTRQEGVVKIQQNENIVPSKQSGMCVNL